MSSEESRAFGEALLRPFLEQTPSGSSGGSSGSSSGAATGAAAAAAALPALAASPVVLIKGDQRLSDVIAEYAEASRADLVVCGSHHLSTTGALPRSRIL